MLQIPMRCALEGSNQFARAQRISTFVVLLSAVSCWLAIACGLGLYSIAISGATTAISALLMFGIAARPFLALIRRSGHGKGFHWVREFWPQQWRIALSFACGYCMFQSFVPVTFYLQGPVIAGQIGASLQLYQVVNSVASSWINPKGPQMGMLCANGQFSKVEAIVRRAKFLSSAVAIVCSLLVLAVLFVLKIVHDGRFAGRFVATSGVALLLLAAIVVQRSNIETLAIRFQKQEPFILLSLVSAVLVVASNIVFGSMGNPTAICGGFLGVIGIVTVPWVHAIYRRRMHTASAAQLKA
jgi:hypothetical protein